MAGLIKSWRAEISGAIVVVTGGFHTLELLNWSTIKAQATAKPPMPAPEQWLIRYGFAQLDGLNNYSAGMPSPAYYQLLWDGLRSEHANPWLAATETLLLELVSRTRCAGLAETLSTADLQAAVLQAMRLADLRGHPGPGRTDLLDAITSCFIKRASDDGQSGLLLDTRLLLAGSRLGNIPASAGSPPLVEDARAQAKANGLIITDSESRLAKLDIYRKPKHQVRSRFFHLISYLDVDLARNENGPNFLAGTKLDLLFEDWRYAWSPTVEAQLIALSNSGERLQTAALAKLIQEEKAIGQSGQGRSAAKLVHLLIRACLMGLHEQLTALFKLLEAHLNEDADFNSVVTCGHHLLTLWQAREPLGVKDDPRILDFLERVWSAALFLLPSIAAVKAEQEPQTIAQLIGFRELTQRLNKSTQDMDLFLDRLQDITHSAAAAPGVIAGSACILYLEGRWNGQLLAQLTAARLGRGSLGEDANRFLNGLMYTAPELLLYEQDLLQSINQLISHWSESDFISFLPDLRQSFTQLKPSQTEKLAELLLNLNDAEGEQLLQYHQDISEQNMTQGLSLQTTLDDTMKREGLAHWFLRTGEGSEHDE